jgi:hypothetical protein
MAPEARRRDLDQAAQWRTIARQQAMHRKTLERRERQRAAPGTPEAAPAAPGDEARAAKARAAAETRRPPGA